ncbi:hypothetical protein ccbrp13_29750 [Ktedonobacteria bacterium brp13]|nr:hypothetical protein ccbrp13_29750 [Ktedonobacteria bacterium brp13]
MIQSGQPSQPNTPQIIKTDPTGDSPSNWVQDGLISPHVQQQVTRGCALYAGWQRAMASSNSL